MSIGSLFTAGRFAYATVSGVDAFTDAVGRYAIKLALRSRAADADLGERIVDEARARAPKDTGNLVNGITTRQEDDGAVIVEASAINARTGYDYARAVELGHNVPTRYADASYFDATDSGGAPRRRASSGGSRVDPEPFFFGPAEEVLRDRGTSLEEMAGLAADEEGLT